ncbi:MAG: MBL fold metallo-hydrolase [Candidatus Eremiobacteraeota bacterium]|nr:MBL fold metallo-hydrolase [Candidatus Eremiobacteraeota bacterium]
MWWRFGETQIHVDPGPGALVRALSHVPPCQPAHLDAIVLSHKHLDHAGDVNVMIEAMSQGGWRPRGMVLAPQDAFEGEPVIFPYLRRFIPRIEYLREHGGPYAIGEIELRGSIRHKHAVETYGLHLRYRKPDERELRVSYLPCTRYFEGLLEDYGSQRPDLLIVNVLRFRDTMDVDHMTFDQAKGVIAAVRPSVAVLTHFGTRMLEQDPRRLARELEDELGLRVHAARDGWTLDVETEVAAIAG